MNNIMLLVELDNAKSDTLDKFNNKLKIYFQEIGYETLSEDNEFFLFKREKNDEHIAIEFKKLNQLNKYIYNIFYENSLNKKKLLLNIFLNELVISSIVLFDTGSNKLLNKYRCDLSNLENIIKYYLCSMIISFQGGKVFDIIENMKVKEYIGKNCYKNMVTSLQRIELKSIFEFIRTSPLGGDEINILRNLSGENSGYNTRCSIELVKKTIENNIFKELSNLINKYEIQNIVMEWRNIISHNACIEADIFIKLGEKVKQLNGDLKKLCIDMQKEEVDQEIDNMPDISLAVKSYESKSTIIFRIIDILNKKFDDKLISEFINKDNVKIDEEYIKFESENINIYIKDIKPQIDFYDGDSMSYIVSIFFAKTQTNFNGINFDIYKLFDSISEKYIVLFDTISDELCNKLYTNINSVENLVRLYVKVSEKLFISEKGRRVDKTKSDKSKMRMAYDLNALRISTEDNKIDLINNELYENDFISLLDKLSSPLRIPKYSELIETKFENINDFNKSIADLSAIDENIASIKEKWRELYRIRTMVSHNYVLDYLNFLKYEEMYLQASKEINEAIFNLLKNNIREYNIDCSIGDEINSFILKDVNCNSSGIMNIASKYKVELTSNRECKFSYYITLDSVWKVINKLFKLDMNDDVIFLTSNNITKHFNNIRIDKITEEDIKKDLKSVSPLYKYSSGNKSKNYRAIEDAIGELLKYIAEEYNR